MNDRHPEQGPDRRAAQRYRIELPVELEGGTGITASVSTTGVVFRTDRSFAVGAPIRFSLRLQREDETAPTRLRCEGTVLKVEQCGGQWTVTASISASRFYD